MTPFWSDDHLTLYGGDCRSVLAALPERSVHCVVTSPPYWGLRDYGTAAWEGGEPLVCPECHGARETPESAARDEGCPRCSGIGTIACDHSSGKGTNVRVCVVCGAVRRDLQLGLEPTPEEYVANMVAVFREVRRVLRDDGTLWLNLGDSYASSPPGVDGVSSQSNLHGARSSGKYRETLRAGHGTKRNTVVGGLKPKDLVGIPWRVAFALQADGWYLRSDVIWSKPNPMPESVTDRPTKAHEYLFLMSKSARYYYDAEAVRESANTSAWPGIGPKHGTTDTHRSDYEPMTVNAGRNLRSVWTIATEPYPGAHFATFPRKLVEPCVKAGCPEGGVTLDPFAGSGTTLMVAQALGRRGIGIDLNPEYLEQALRRNAQAPLGLGG